MSKTMLTKLSVNIIEVWRRVEAKRSKEGIKSLALCCLSATHWREREKKSPTNKSQMEPFARSIWFKCLDGFFECAYVGPPPTINSGPCKRTHKQDEEIFKCRRTIERAPVPAMSGGKIDSHAWDAVILTLARFKRLILSDFTHTKPRSSYVAMWHASLWGLWVSVAQRGYKFPGRGYCVNLTHCLRQMTRRRMRQWSGELNTTQLIDRSIVNLDFK